MASTQRAEFCTSDLAIFISRFASWCLFCWSCPLRDTVSGHPQNQKYTFRGSIGRLYAALCLHSTSFSCLGWFPLDSLFVSTNGLVSNSISSSPRRRPCSPRRCRQSIGPSLVGFFVPHPLDSNVLFMFVSHSVLSLSVSFFALDLSSTGRYVEAPRVTIERIVWFLLLSVPKANKRGVAPFISVSQLRTMG